MISVIKFDSFFVLVDNQNQQPLYEQLLLYYRVLVAPSDLQLGLLASPRDVKHLFVMIFIPFTSSLSIKYYCMHYHNHNIPFNSLSVLP